MNNPDVAQVLSACDAELVQVQEIIANLGVTSAVVPYLTKYAVVRACGSIETSFKAVIADYSSHRSIKQVKRFIDRRIRDGSANPTIENMNKFLLDFDKDWQDTFKRQLNAEPNRSALITSLQSLVNARNEFAHGGNPTTSLTDVIQYFGHAKRIVEIMDLVVS
ncbi:MAG: hypothetical protein KKH74_12725 [Gammaproteobacteria bacterium]|nr:hypothetical protein [Gammaproteobacteria bacterium]MBU1731858.1 hypothetical protein [Gammaproteobacteria bacterium]MBU1892469.1 hypothetical protein [Gammaproteobacteria bacterium]